MSAVLSWAGDDDGLPTQALVHPSRSRARRSQPGELPPEIEQAIWRGCDLGALMWPLLRPSPHDLRNWRSLVPEWAVSALVNVGFAASPLTPVNPDLNGDGQVDIRDIQQVTAC